MILGQRNSKQKASDAFCVVRKPKMLSSSTSSSCLYDGDSYIVEEERDVPDVLGQSYSITSTNENNHQCNETPHHQISSSTSSYLTKTASKATTLDKVLPMMTQTKWYRIWLVSCSSSGCGNGIGGVSNRGTNTARQSCSLCFTSLAVLFSVCIFVSIMYMVNQYDDILGQDTVRKSPLLVRHDKTQQSQQQYYFHEEEEKPWHVAMSSHDIIKGGHREEPQMGQREKHNQQRAGVDPTAEAPNHIKAISILGERNSGTTWMYE